MEAENENDELVGNRPTGIYKILPNGHGDLIIMSISLTWPSLKVSNQVSQIHNLQGTSINSLIQ